MAFRAFVAAAAMSWASVAVSGSYDCGVYLGNEDEPAATFTFDTEGSQVSTRVGDITAIAKRDGSYVVMAIVASDRTTSAAVFTPDSPLFDSILVKSNGDQISAVCVGTGKKLAPLGRL